MQTLTAADSLLSDTDTAPPVFIPGPSCYLIEDLLSEMEAPSCLLIYADIDHFRALNSALGYKAGDDLIQQIMGLFNEHIDSQIGLYRVGSGFFIILPDAEPEIIEQQCQHINKDLLNESLSDATGVIVTVSFGIAWHLAGNDPAVALAEAEAVCRQAKHSSRGSLMFSSERLAGSNSLAKQMKQLRAVHDALNDDRLCLYAQPIGVVSDKLADLNSLNRRFEILIRMKNELGELVSPDTFLPVAERYGLITEIDKWVVEHLFAYMAKHPEKMDGIDAFAINLSGKSINDDVFIAFVFDALAATPYPEKVCFEITETALISDLESAKDFVQRANDFGSKVSLDDFGSGLCSFGYLKNINADYVKIDGSFIRTITRSSSDLAMVKAITDIGHVLGKKVVGEYVTDEATLSMLGAIGVDYAQGYHIGKPLPLR